MFSAVAPFDPELSHESALAASPDNELEALKLLAHAANDNADRS